ncbi:MAG: helix-turn-helix domain-containing protein [Lachnospiraceae bacterium]|nr:helix-turn-helix domain-containing protein [Lachnospiraceae bacterium]
MGLLSLSIGERLEALGELLSCAGRMYRWSYDAEGNLLETDCPDRVLDKAFKASGSMDAIREHAEGSREPMVVSIPYGLSWSAAYEYEEERLAKIHVLGPITPVELSAEAINRAIQNPQIPVRWRPKLIRILQRIPVMSSMDFFRITLMLHYCVTGERLTNADIFFREPDLKRPDKENAPKKDRINTYRTEQALMRMVTEGDVNYKSVLHDAASASRGVRASVAGSLEQVKVSQIVFISLCTRAAIQGGISPEVAYTRGDAYIQDIMDCRTVADAARIGHTMYDDFINMVHKRRAQETYSPQIQSCCDYIELHIEDKLSLSEIAGRIGYAEYYLSRKFKAETGTGINDYIKQAKIEKAKTLLLSSDLSIQEICDRLHFGSRSFFAETFREIAGIPPAAFREMNQKL